MPTIIALLALAGIQIPPAPASPAPVPPPAASASPADLADERCLAAFAYLASEPGATDDAARAGRYRTMFFYGKLMGRDPSVDLGAALPGVAADIAGRMRAETDRCTSEVEAAGHAMAAAGDAARRAPAAR